MRCFYLFSRECIFKHELLCLVQLVTHLVLRAPDGASERKRREGWQATASMATRPRACIAPVTSHSVPVFQAKRPCGRAREQPSGKKLHKAALFRHKNRGGVVSRLKGREGTLLTFTNEDGAVSDRRSRSALLLAYGSQECRHQLPKGERTR